MLYLFNPFLGQISRGQWWLAQLAIFVLCFFAALIVIFMSATPPTGGFKSFAELTQSDWVIIIVGGYMSFCAGLNRLRDSGRSGLWYLAFFVPIIGFGLMIYFCGIETGTAKSQTSKSGRLRTPQQFDQPSVATAPTFGRR